MIEKQSYCLTEEINGRVYRLECSADSPITEVRDVLAEMHFLIVEKMRKAQAVSKEETPVDLDEVCEDSCQGH